MEQRRPWTRAPWRWRLRERRAFHSAAGNSVLSKKKVFGGVDHPLKANLFENVRAVAFKFLLWAFEGVPFTARTRDCVDSAPKQGSDLARGLDARDFGLSHDTTNVRPPQPTPPKFENTFVIWIQRLFPLPPLLQTRSILPPRAAVLVHSGVSGVRF